MDRSGSPVSICGILVAMAANPTRTRKVLLEFALSLPGAFEDHPWGEAVAKVNGKIFVFFGAGEGTPTIAIAVMLDESLEQALAVPEAAPTGYGLGRAGWVTVPLLPTTPPLDVLKDWVEESYRRVAPKRLVKELDEGRG
jgi:predicted DNA-binding protein (MmcQ/YjbR family)